MRSSAAPGCAPSTCRRSRSSSSISGSSSEASMAALTDDERKVLLAIQDGLPIEREPYRAVADGIGMPEEQVIEVIRQLLEERKIKRIGAVPNHYALGITANGMSVWDVPDDVASEVGRRLGERREITHCYRRPRR